MHIGILGAGFTGLAAAYELSQKGHAVTLFEKDSQPGGLAIGYKEKGWDWTLEKHYHHWFTNDTAVLGLAKEIGYEVIIKRPHTNWYVQDTIYPFDSVGAALLFPLISPIERFRNLATLGFLKLNPFWQPLEKLNAATILPKLMGKKPYEMLWEPLFINKFGKYATNISFAWFWARIFKRTQSLAYPKGGFLAFAQNLTSIVATYGTRVVLNCEVIALKEKNQKIVVEVKAENKVSEEQLDIVIVTLPSFLFAKLTPTLPSSYTNQLLKLKGLGATNLILRLKNPFFSDDTYWLSIADRTSPVMAIVEHTNFMDKQYYNNEHLVYCGNYLSPDSEKYGKSKEEIFKLYTPYLRKINPDFEKSLIGYELFKVPFAQPIIPPNYSKLIPPFRTPIKNLYLANMQQVYPWDRGTNYAVELGQKVARMILEKS